jgi:(2S)-methylsuccinyl-CoA dehydrogenase
MSSELMQIINEAEAHIAKGRATVNKALSAVKARCSDNGKVSAVKLDEQQLVTYELAYCVAELSSAQHMVDYVRALQEQKTLNSDAIEYNMALIITAEALRNCQSRLANRLDDFGLVKADLSESFDSDETAAFCQMQLGSKRLEALGQQLTTLNGYTGEYLLEEEKVMMQDTFRPFAQEVVYPLAEEIHRHDLDIPDEIIKPLVELGCFGLSIPMQYGGLQPDDQEDNLGMIVVTEELSRGSLGAAGSLITRPTHRSNSSSLKQLRSLMASRTVIAVTRE